MNCFIVESDTGKKKGFFVLLSIQFCKVHLSFSEFVEGCIVVHLLSLLARAAPGVPKLKAAGLDEHFRVPRIGFVFEAGFCDSNNAAKDATFFVAVTGLSETAFNFQLKDQRKFVLIPH